jgi:dihydroxyacetone kinase
VACRLWLPARTGGQRGINVRRNYVGEYCTSLDMAGMSITLSRLDDEITTLLAAPAQIANQDVLSTRH